MVNRTSDFEFILDVKRCVLVAYLLRPAAMSAETYTWSWVGGVMDAVIGTSEVRLGLS